MRSVSLLTVYTYNKQWYLCCVVARTVRLATYTDVDITTTLKFLPDYEPVKPSRCHKISFVPAGKLLPTKKHSKIQGILHLASDWRLLSDLDLTLIVPPYLAVTQLRPDILLTSAMTKIVIILELTCPCEEYMETWHGVKVDKYLSLCSVMRLNNWSVHFFVVEVGARGFCSENVRICLRRLGFSNMSVRYTLKSLTESSMRSSFYIWLSRDSLS
ncbi:uncharacterized protein LOC130648580 [Hydractinia symbiolongicarpus]|uniref:uncharacterized protein LOC130648580 n=1 Tax=Hydractinia symbiolongicarpus TaxID=13093 RepID=UPI00254D8D55|nr:uncharacterized protein LOC130648580 [Hydractinia symbiolongicarpus]